MKIQKLFIITTIIIFTLTKKEKLCNTELIRLFNLKGRLHPKYASHVDICGKTMDSCCTIIDELKIIKMWKEHSLVHIRFKIKEILSSYNSIFSLHDMFLALHSGLVPVHFPKERWVPYIWQSCSKIFREHKDDGKEIFDENEGKNALVVDFLDNTRKLKKVNKIGGNDEIGKNDVGEQGSVWKGNSERELSQGSKIFLNLSKSEKNAIESANYIKGKFNRTIQNSVKKFHDFYQNYENVDKIVEKLTKEKEHITNILNLAEKNPEILKSRALKMDKKIPKSDTFNLQLLDNFYNDHTKVEDVKISLKKKREEIIEELEEIKNFGNYKVLLEKKMLMENLSIPIDNNYMGGLISEINNNIIPTINKTLPFFPIRQRKSPKFASENIPYYECKHKNRELYRKFFILNEGKYKYCDRIYGNLRNFNMNHFEKYMENIRDSMLRLNFIKKSVYCSVCDINEQKFIDLQEEKFYFKKGFCRKFVYQFKSYLEWKNIIFVEYLNNLLQYVECHQTNGANVDFPYKSGLEKLYKKIYFYKRCFDNLHNDRGFFKYCHFICKEFRFERMSSELEGDMIFMKNMYLRLVSFLRSQNVSIQTPFHKEMLRVTGDFSDIPKSHLDPKTGVDIENAIVKEENLILAQERYLRKKIMKDQKENGVTVENIIDERDRDLLKEGGERKLLSEEELKNNPNILLLNKNEKNETKTNDFNLKEKKIVEKNSKDEKKNLNNKKKNKIDIKGRILGANIPVYEYSNPLPAISDFISRFLNGNLGLNPFETDSLMNTNYEIEDYLDNYKKNNSGEAINPEVLKIVVLDKKMTDNFNEDIDIGFGSDDEKLESKNLESNVNKRRFESLVDGINYNVLNKKKEGVQEMKPVGLAKKDGVPELDYIFN